MKEEESRPYLGDRAVDRDEDIGGVKYIHLNNADDSKNGVAKNTAKIKIKVINRQN